MKLQIYQFEVAEANFKQKQSKDLFINRNALHKF